MNRTVNRDTKVDYSLFQIEFVTRIYKIPWKMIKKITAIIQLKYVTMFVSVNFCVISDTRVDCSKKYLSN